MHSIETNLNAAERVSDVFVNPIAQDIFKQKYSWDGKETWAQTAHRVVTAVCGTLLSHEECNQLIDLIRDRKFIPAGRYLHSAGREAHYVNNCYVARAEDSREGWADLVHKSTMMLATGGGLGVDYSAVREEGALIRKTGGIASGPISLMNMVNEIGRNVMAGGGRRSALWAGLDWQHKDVEKFLKLKDWSPELRALKEKDPVFPLPMELTNISVIYDKAFFDAVNAGDERALRIWELNCRQAFSTAEPGMSFNYLNPRNSLRNACTELTSDDDSDKCNLGTVWMNRFKSMMEFAEATRLATLFLLCGGIYSQVPTEKVREVGTRNNRIGLGLGGMHEWLMQRGCDYEVTPEMHRWLSAWVTENEWAAVEGAERFGVNVPIGKRAIAPNGTIGMLAETTTGIEALICAAYKRLYFKAGRWLYQYVIDGAAKRLMEQGVPVEVIERNDAYALSFQQRVKFQADVQDYVDMAISSTCNLPAWGSEKNNDETLKEYSKILLSYGPRLRGFTCYPDGARGGQPITKVSVAEAREQEGMVFRVDAPECLNGVCGV